MKGSKSVFMSLAIAPLLVGLVACTPNPQQTTNKATTQAATQASMATGTLARVVHATYHAADKRAVLQVTSSRNTPFGEYTVDLGSKESLVHFATAYFPKDEVQSVQVVGTNLPFKDVISVPKELRNKALVDTTRATRAPGFFNPQAQDAVTTLASGTQRFVETNRGWVSYHAAPHLNSPVIGRLQSGQRAALLGTPNRYWYEISVNGHVAYITTSSRYVHVVTGTGRGTTQAQPAPTPPKPSAPATQPALPTAPTSPVTRAGSIPLPPPGVHMDAGLQPQAGLNASGSAKFQALLSVAQSKLGTPYIWGHNEDRGQYGFDCSNFMAYVYHHALGYVFTGASQGQYHYVGVSVPISSMQPGDLIIFNSGSHVGMYIGNGQMIQEGGGLGKVGYLPVHPGSYWGNHISAVKRMF